MAADRESAVAQAIETGIGLIYDRVAVDKNSVLKAGSEFHTGFDTWEEYQRKAGIKLMDQIADEHIRNCKIAVSALGAAAGFGGFATIVPDTLQFITLTLRMVTGIAAAYGFDPDPYFMKGKTKVLVMQAYLNANLGQTTQKGIEAVTLSATTRLMRNAATRSDLLVRIIIVIARLVGLRITRQGILRSIPLLSSGTNAGFNWYYARQIAESAKAEFRQFRTELRQGKYRDDPAYEGFAS